LKSLLSFALFILFASSLDASYARSIRVASFYSEESAQKGVAELRKFVNRDYRLSQLQREFNSDITVIRSGKYYISVIQPVTRRDAVQEMLDIVRIRYPEAYPKKITLDSPRQRYVEPPRKTYREEPQRIDRQDLTNQVDRILTQEVVEPVNRGIDVENIELKSVPLDDIIEDDIVEDEVPHVNKKIVLRSATREDVAEVGHTDDESHDEGFSLFGVNLAEMFDSISFDIFSDDEPEHVQHEESFLDSKLEKISNYILEIGVIFAFLLFLIFIKLYLVYQGRKEDKISMQDIYE
jgi:hypothetical protein